MTKPMEKRAWSGRPRQASIRLALLALACTSSAAIAQQTASPLPDVYEIRDSNAAQCVVAKLTIASKDKSNRARTVLLVCDGTLGGPSGGSGPPLSQLYITPAQASCLLREAGAGAVPLKIHLAQCNVRPPEAFTPFRGRRNGRGN
ncbi:hypothetical protein ACCC88_05240 [Sphingomonas sp. Sphisp140]|uniref:hypothetical protein n=1 Tax=unclassified Sphingomonas TaxID=196159 RepID=UPI0039B0BD3B